MRTPTNAFFRLLSIITRTVAERAESLPIRRVYNSENNIRTGSSSPAQPYTNQVPVPVDLAQNQALQPALVQAQPLIESPPRGPLSDTLPSAPAAGGQAERPQEPNFPAEGLLSQMRSRYQTPPPQEPAASIPPQTEAVPPLPSAVLEGANTEQGLNRRQRHLMQDNASMEASAPLKTKTKKNLIFKFQLISEGVKNEVDGLEKMHPNLRQGLSSFLSRFNRLKENTNPPSQTRPPRGVAYSSERISPVSPNPRLTGRSLQFSPIQAQTSALPLSPSLELPNQVRDETPDARQSGAIRRARGSVRPAIVFPRRSGLQENQRLDLMPPPPPTDLNTLTQELASVFQVSPDLLSPTDRSTAAQMIHEARELSHQRRTSITPTEVPSIITPPQSPTVDTISNENVISADEEANIDAAIITPPEVPSIITPPEAPSIITPLEVPPIITPPQSPTVETISNENVISADEQADIDAAIRRSLEAPQDNSTQEEREKEKEERVNRDRECLALFLFANHVEALEWSGEISIILNTVPERTIKNSIDLVLSAYSHVQRYKETKKRLSTIPAKTVQDLRFYFARNIDSLVDSENALEEDEASAALKKITEQNTNINSPPKKKRNKESNCRDDNKKHSEPSQKEKKKVRFIVEQARMTLDQDDHVSPQSENADLYTSENFETNTDTNTDTDTDKKSDFCVEASTSVSTHDDGGDNDNCYPANSFEDLSDRLNDFSDDESSDDEFSDDEW